MLQLLAFLPALAHRLSCCCNKRLSSSGNRCPSGLQGLRNRKYLEWLCLWAAGPGPGRVYYSDLQPPKVGSRESIDSMTNSEIYLFYLSSGELKRV